MNALSDLPQLSRLLLYVLMVLMGLLAVALALAQISLFRGRPFANPDGTRDDWREQKLFYGMAVADLVVSIPATVLGLGLTFAVPRVGLFLLGAVAFWMVWVNLVTTATSLRFEAPRLTAEWFVVFPLGTVVGAAFLVWLALHFTVVFG